MLHEEFVEAFGTDCVDDLVYGEDEYIHLPTVFKAADSDFTCVGLAYVDLDSSGEHYSSTFAFSKGMFVDGCKYDNEAMQQARNMLGKYDYWYTPVYDGDIHTSRATAPKEVIEMLEYATEEQEQTQGMNMDSI